jgi:hypothetical protein
MTLGATGRDCADSYGRASEAKEGRSGGVRSARLQGSNVVWVDQMESRASEAQPRRVLSARMDEMRTLT